MLLYCPAGSDTETQHHDLGLQDDTQSLTTVDPNLTPKSAEGASCSSFSNLIQKLTL
jgi:hypothetical protein